MGRRSTGVLEVEDCKSIPIKFLKVNKYLEPGQTTRATLTFTNRGNPTGSIGIEVNMEAGNERIRLYYTNTYYNGEKESINYTVNLIPIKSNLGRGVRWYYQCPVTFKLCTSLLKGNSKYFKSRAAHNGLSYSSQNEGKRFRSFKLFTYENKLEELYMRRGKTTYKGKPTRLQVRIDKLENKLNSYSLDSLRHLLDPPYKSRQKAKK